MRFPSFPGSRPGPYQGRHVERVPHPSDCGPLSIPPRPITEKSLRTFPDPHLAQTNRSLSASSAWRKKASNRCPHSSHRYSNIGTSTSSLNNDNPTLVPASSAQQ